MSGRASCGIEQSVTGAGPGVLSGCSASSDSFYIAMGYPAS